MAADGANGRTAWLAGLEARRWMTVALEGNITPPDGVPAEWADVLGFDLGDPPGGYGWIFPKGDHLNVGVWGWPHVGPRLRASLGRVTRLYGFDPSALEGVRGYRLPVRRPGSPLAEGNLLLVGDAAGLLDPFTGEGIHGAVWSGRAAAGHLAAYLGGETPDLQGYARQVRRELAPDLHTAGRLADLFQMIPTVYMLFAGRTSRGWRLICRLARGERTYTDLRGAVGPLLSSGLDFASDLLRVTPGLQRRAGLQDLPAPERFLRRSGRGAG